MFGSGRVGGVGGDRIGCMKVEARDDIIKRSIKLAMSTKLHTK